MGIFLEAGTQAGIKIKEDVPGIKSGDLFKSTNISALGGIGYQSKMGLGIEARYIYGLTKIGNPTLLGANTNLKNSNAQVSLFYMF